MAGWLRVQTTKAIAITQASTHKHFNEKISLSSTYNTKLNFTDNSETLFSYFVQSMDKCTKVLKFVGESTARTAI